VRQNADRADRNRGAPDIDRRLDANTDSDTRAVGA
jgi:hypothetical protein